MSVLPPLLVLIASFGIFIGLVIYSRMVPGAWWYGTRYEGAVVHGGQPCALLFTVGALVVLEDELDSSRDIGVFEGLAIPALFVLLVVAWLGFFGVRLPPPFVPRWIRERRRREKALRRARRERRDTP